MNSARFIYRLIGAEQGPEHPLLHPWGPAGLGDGAQPVGLTLSGGELRPPCFTHGAGHGQLVHCAHTLRPAPVRPAAPSLTRRLGSGGTVLFRRATARAA